MQHKSKNKLLVEQIQIKNFRCFREELYDISSPILLIEGQNGSGKTSLLEALYYPCFLRSFRTHAAKELVNFAHQALFIKLHLTRDGESCDVLQVGFSTDKKLVKFNSRSISSYKDLILYYRVVSLTEDDLMLIKGMPAQRRAFLDQIIVLQDTSFLQEIKRLRNVVDQRNSLFKNRMSRSPDILRTWTHELFRISQSIQAKREHALAQLELSVNSLLSTQFSENLQVKFSYKKKNLPANKDFDYFWTEAFDLFIQEQKIGHSLFGAHLDDFEIIFQESASRSFASRGEQKLIITLIKIAQIEILSEKHGITLFLIDDFVTDFDEIRLKILIEILVKIDSQLILTIPSCKSPLQDLLAPFCFQHIKLTYRNK